jgi:hypothetical protein
MLFINFFAQKYAARANTAPKNSVPGKLLFCLCCAYFLYAAIRTISDFQGFLSQTILTNASSVVSVLILSVAAVYAAFSGLEVIARTGAVVFAVFILCFAALFAFNASSFDVLNLEPQITFAKTSQMWLRLLFNTGEIVVLPFLLGYCRSGKEQNAKEQNAKEQNAEKNLPLPKRGIVIFCFAAPLFIALCSFLALLSLGRFSQLTLYPVYEMAGSGGIGAFSRLEIFYSVSWAAGILTRVTLLAFCAKKCLLRLIAQPTANVLRS